jgi:hypothetical protein
MAARIVSLGRPNAAADALPRSVGGVPLHRQPRGEPGHQPGRHVWRGASGRDYAHNVYSLIECPPLPRASYVLARRDADGRCVALHVGLGTSGAPTLNLAQVRRQGAQAGANEVHVHYDAASDAGRRLVACDLRTALFGDLSATGAGHEAR